MRQHPRRAAATIVLGLVLVTTACSSGSSSRSATSPATGTGQKDAAAPGAVTGNGAAGSGQQQAKPGQVSAAQGRQIVYTASISVNVTDLRTAADKVERMATDSGGFVSADERQITDSNPTAKITLRIPADKFGGTLDAVGALGKESSRQLSTQDVTAQAIDLDARIQSQQASVNRVRDLLAKAQTITDITTIESELAKREADLESLQSQQRNLADLTQLSTVTITLLGPALVTTPQPPKPKAPPGFLGGLKAGWHAFVATLRVVLAVFGALLPWLIALAVPLGAYYVYWRRRHSRRPPPPVTGPLPTPPPSTVEEEPAT